MLREKSSDGKPTLAASIVGTMSANIKTPASAASNYPELTLFIDGEWLGTQGRKTQPVVNPATEEVLGQLPHASAADLDRALAAAQRAWGEWRALLPVQRERFSRRPPISCARAPRTSPALPRSRWARASTRRASKCCRRRRSSTGTPRKAGVRTDAYCRNVCRASA